MPELPEVETLRRQLAATLVGRVVAAVEVRSPSVFRPAPGLAASDLLGARFVAARRRSKFLALDLSRPDGELCLVFHLRLAGQLVLTREGRVAAAGGHPVPAFGTPLPHRQTHLVLGLDDGSQLHFTDLRRFGFWMLLPAAAATAYLDEQGLGPEATELTPAELAAALARSPRARLKSLLLDQRAIAGLGNIYADEALWLARLNPLRSAGSLTPDETLRLQRAIGETLEHALTHGVARVIGGRAAPDRDFPRAHGREGEGCPRCGTAIARRRVGGRSTYLCPACQPATPPAP